MPSAVMRFVKKRGPDGGIGRRVRLKIWLSQGSAGSIPVPGTKAFPTKLGGLFCLVAGEFTRQSEQMKKPQAAIADWEALGKANARGSWSETKLILTGSLNWTERFFPSSVLFHFR